MCMFVLPVRDVSGTKLLLSFVREANSGRVFQLTCYGNNVKDAARTDGRINAMILPVPAGIDDVRFCQTQSDWVTPIMKELFDEFERTRYRELSRGSYGATAQSFSFGGKETMKVLPTFRVGSYTVSKAASIDDLLRIDPSKFVVDPKLHEILKANYNDNNWSFIVAGLGNDETYHPLCYLHPLAKPDSPLFIPLRHYHKHQEPISFGWSATPHVSSMEEYDHEIYMLGLPKDAIDTVLKQPGGLPVPEALYLRSRGAQVTLGETPDQGAMDAIYNRIAKQLTFGDRDLKWTFGERGIYRWTIKGFYTNNDAWVMPYGDSLITNVGLNRDCDSCKKKLSDTFFHCSTCLDIDQCPSCNEQRRPLQHDNKTHFMVPVRTWKQHATTVLYDTEIMVMSDKLLESMRSSCSRPGFGGSSTPNPSAPGNFTLSPAWPSSRFESNPPQTTPSLPNPFGNPAFSRFTPGPNIFGSS